MPPREYVSTKLVLVSVFVMGLGCGMLLADFINLLTPSRPYRCLYESGDIVCRPYRDTQRNHDTQEN